jgi:hypothetical protein
VENIAELATFLHKARTYTTQHNICLFIKEPLAYSRSFQDFTLLPVKEGIYRSNRLLWETNYQSTLIQLELWTPDFSQKVFKFRRNALLSKREPAYAPSPDFFQEGDFTLINSALGGFEEFRGKETILFHHDKPVLKIEYSGRLT